MKEFKYTISDPLGIHARPAGLLVKEASKFKSSITIEKGGKSGDAKKIFAIMALGVKNGDEIIVKVQGDDEDEAKNAMESFIKEKL